MSACWPAPRAPRDAGDIATAIRNAANRLQVKHKLAAFGAALQVAEERDMRTHSYHLIRVAPDQHTVSIRTYDRDRRGLVEDTQDYLAEEKRLAGTAGDVVLVASDSLESLRRTFPNYFLDTRTFIEEMERLLA